MKSWTLPVNVIDPSFSFFSLPWIASEAVFGGSVYRGIEGGDSGGPLLAGIPVGLGIVKTVQCGVASGTFPTTNFDFFMCGGVCWAAGQRHVAIDSPEAISWLRPRLTYISNTGTREFLGQCGGVADSVDTNCDLEPDACEPDPDDTSFESAINCLYEYN
jgi:hypothetical protein